MPNHVTDDIFALMHALETGYRTRDLGALDTLLATSVSVTAFGTGVDERCVGRDAVLAQFQKDWALLEAGSVELCDSTITITGDAAWVMSACTLSFRIDGTDGSATGRSSLVCVAESGTWRIAHWHISLPAEI